MLSKKMGTWSAVTVIVTLLVTGCGSGGGTADVARGYPADQAAPRENGLQPDSGDSRSGGSTSAEDSATKARGQLPALTADHERIYTATVRVQARQVEAAATEAKRMVREAGGYVHSETLSSNRDSRRRTTATLKLKVPPEGFSDIYQALSSDLGKRLNRRRQVEDVSGKVADVESRIRSARASLRRLRSFLESADTIDQILQVEDRIATREAELESLQAQARALAAKTKYATVTLHLRSPVRKAEPDPADHDSGAGGFISGLRTGWAAFAAAVMWTLTVLGTLLPFLGLVAVGGIGAWRLRRFVRHRATAGATASAGDSGG